MEIKPLFFSISPINQIIEERVQFNSLSEIEKYTQIAVPEIYLGNSTGALNCQLKEFLSRNINYDGPLIIAINAHSIDSGIEFTGRFSDREFKEEIIIDFDKLWNGTLYFEGLSIILDQLWKGKPVFIVYVHCTGNSKLFLQNLNYSTVGLELPDNITIVALNGTIENDLSRQVQLTKWLENRFINSKKSTIEAFQNPTIQTKIQISENPQYSILFKNELDYQFGKVHIAQELNNKIIREFTF